MFKATSAWARFVPARPGSEPRIRQPDSLLISKAVHDPVAERSEVVIGVPEDALVALAEVVGSRAPVLPGRAVPWASAPAGRLPFAGQALRGQRELAVGERVALRAPGHLPQRS